MNASTLLRAILATTLASAAVAAEAPWPAESVEQVLAEPRQCLAELGGTRNLHLEMSGVHWNPLTRCLWVTAGGGSGEGTWALAYDAVGDRFTVLSSWDKPRDESLTQVSYEPVAPGVHRLHILEEGKPGKPAAIHEADFTIGGGSEVRRTWILPETVSQKKKGAEGLAFVPDAWLARNGFTADDGKPYVSQGGLGGVMVIAHQFQGRILVYDLSADGTPRFGGRDTRLVATFDSARKESSGLEFDRSTGRLWISHNIDGNKLEATDLTAETVPGEGGGPPVRRLRSLGTWDLPKLDNPEGFALAPQMKPDGSPTDTPWAFVVNDREIGENEQQAAILWFRRFKP